MPDSVKRPYLLAQVKFESLADLHLALGNHQTFQVQSKWWCRLVPYQDNQKQKSKVDITQLLKDFTNVLKLALDLQQQKQSAAVEKLEEPVCEDDCSIIVTGFCDDTKEEELISHYYKIVYGGGTRNVNDGKVHSCIIF